MNVVSCYHAAQLAGVTKQNISLKKKVNVDDKSKYKYFAYDKETGEFGVDIEHKDWIKYVKSRESRTVVKNDTSKNTNSKTIVKDLDDYVHKENILTAVVSMLKEDFTFSGAKLKMALEGIERRYKGLEG